MLISAIGVEAKEYNFTLVNDTGMDIYAIYVSPNKEEDYGEDILGLDIIANGENADIQFDREIDVCKWDLMIENENGDDYIWEEIDLCKFSKVTLHYKDGKATPTFE